MHFTHLLRRWVCGLRGSSCAWLLLLGGQLTLFVNPAFAQRPVITTPPATPASTTAPPAATLTLSELEALAMRNNPTLTQAQAALDAAAARRQQAGLWPNPIIGYEGEGLAFNAPVRRSRSGNYVFFEQMIPTGGKLAKSQAIAAQEQTLAQTSLAAQRLKVVNAVRLAFYETLGAQQLVEVREQLVGLTREAVTISEDLYNVGQADRPDVLFTEVELQRAEIELLRAQNDWMRVWQALVAIVNDATLKTTITPVRLAGTLDATVPPLVQTELLAALLQNSPEVLAAQADLARAQAVLIRARAELAPDIFLRSALGKSREFEDLANRPVGWEARVEAGLRLPLWNRNQGNIGAARAEIRQAESELQRVELSLRTRFAASYARYLTALGITARYQRDILPRAQQAYDLYLRKFRQMAAAYPQALLAQRTLFQVRTEYIGALVELWQTIAQLRGQLLVGGLDAPGGGNRALSAATPANAVNAGVH